MALGRERGDRLRADRGHQDHDRLRGQRRGRSVVAERGSLRLRTVRDHDHERVGAGGRRARRALPSCLAQRDLLVIERPIL
jgi:hypothetical protein